MPNLRRLSAKFHVNAAVILLTALSACLSPEMAIEDAAFETTKPRPDEPAIASIDGTYLYASDVSRHAEAQNLIAVGEMLPRTDERFDTALQELIDQRLLALDSLGQNLHRRGGIERRLSLARERILSSVALEEHLAKTVTDVSIRAAYDRQVELGRKAHTFENSRDKIEAMLIAAEVRQYLTSLRENTDIEVLKVQETDIKETEIIETEDE